MTRSRCTLIRTGLIALVLLVATRGYARENVIPSYRIDLGCERENVVIRTVLLLAHDNPLLGDPVDRVRRLAIDLDGRIKLVQRPSDLRGHLQVGDRAAALRVARLWTSPSIAYMFRHTEIPISFEIVPRNRVKHLPNFRGDRLQRRRWGLPAGTYGVLPARKFKAAGFQEPITRPVCGGFEVVRWLLYDTQVMRVREFVGNDGMYRRETLERRPAPQIRGVSWSTRLPQF